MTFYLEEGKRVGLIGVNGTGKSTLLKILAGAEEPDEGTLARDPNIQVSYLPQNPDMTEDATVLEQIFLHFPPEFRALKEYEAKTMLTRLGITDFDARISTLSGGQRKRVALAGALVHELRPAALLCVDSLCSAEPQRLGRTLQFSDTGLCPAQPGSARHLDARRLGVPVVAAGIPTLREAKEGRDLVVTPRELDSVIAHGAALLGTAINRALQPRLSIAQLCWLAG